MAIYSGFSHKKWWFSIVMLVYQRVHVTIHRESANRGCIHQELGMCQERRCSAPDTIFSQYATFGRLITVFQKWKHSFSAELEKTRSQFGNHPDSDISDGDVENHQYPGKFQLVQSKQTKCPLTAQSGQADSCWLHLKVALELRPRKNAHLRP